MWCLAFSAGWLLNTRTSEVEFLALRRLPTWSITIRRSRSRSRAPPDSPDACHHADLPSRPRRSAIHTSLHPTQRHIPREAGALHPVEEVKTAWRPCRPVPPTTTIRFHEDWRIFSRKAGILVQLNRRRRPIREIPHQRALVTFRRAGSDCATRRADWPTAQTTCRVRLGRQFCLAEI